MLLVYFLMAQQPTLALLQRIGYSELAITVSQYPGKFEQYLNFTKAELVSPVVTQCEVTNLSWEVIRDIARLSAHYR